jgi:hypothetical protein
MSDSYTKCLPAAPSGPLKDQTMFHPWMKVKYFHPWMKVAIFILG